MVLPYSESFISSSRRRSSIIVIIIIIVSVIENRKVDVMLTENSSDANVFVNGENEFGTPATILPTTVTH